MITSGLFSSKTDLWETPQNLFDELNNIHHFTLDVCATVDNAKCDKFYTIVDNGLIQEWSGVCWCNPPYGRSIGKWVEKAFRSHCKTVLLLPARTDTLWFHNYCLKGDIIFLKGRLKFGNAKYNAPFPSMIVIFNLYKEE